MRPRGRAAGAAVIVCAFWALAGCAPAAPPTGPVPPRAPSSATASTAPAQADGRWRPTGDAVTLAEALDAPWSVIALGSGGALISERSTGSILELTPDGALREAGVVPGVVAGGESGLHGLAIWVDDDGDRWLYAYHGAVEDNRVVRMRLTGVAGSLALGAPEVVFSGIPRANTHNGGRIAFGPDGFLYVTTGDAQIRDAAQDPASLGGKILRITPEGEAAAGNPFENAVFSLGHRNVQGLTWTADGELWASEFGQNTWDELNHIVAGGNYGWPAVEGTADDPQFENPVAVWATSDASPSGIAAVGSTVFVAALRGERLWAVDVTPAHTAETPAIGWDGQGRLRDVVAAPDGGLWVLTNNTDGRGSPRTADDILVRLPLDQIP